MGLNAAVVADPDADTGDVEQVLAEARLGNAAMIGHLYSIAVATLGSNSILATKVLYSGTHGGDFIDQQGVLALADELRSWDNTDRDVTDFKKTMLDLVEVAIRHDAVILF